MTPNPTKSERRVQFDFSAERLAELDRLMELCDFATRKDLVNHALSLFEWAVDTAIRGQSIAAYDRRTDHVEIIKMIPLEAAARKSLSHTAIGLVRTDGGADADNSKAKLPRPSLVSTS